MLVRALAQAAQTAQGLSPTLVLVVIVGVAVAFFWRFLIKLGIAALIIGFLFVLISAARDILLGLHALIP